MNEKSKDFNDRIDSVKNHVNVVIGKRIYFILHKLGVELDDPIVIETATEAFTNYIEMIGQISSSIAMSAGRIHVNMLDIKKAVKCIDNKRFEQLVSGSEFPGILEGNFQELGIIKKMVPTIHFNDYESWREAVKSRKLLRENMDIDLFEYLDSKPKNIPDFLPSFPPKIYYDKHYRN